MSRIGKAPVFFDDKIQINVTPANEVVVKGAKSSLNIQMRPEVGAQVEGKKITLVRKADTKEARSLTVFTEL